MEHAAVVANEKAVEKAVDWDFKMFERVDSPIYLGLIQDDLRRFELMGNGCFYL